jgi:hypothetical protein
MIFSRNGIMEPWEKMYPSIDFENFLGYPHYFDTRWQTKYPRFQGLPLTHVVEFLKYVCQIEVGGEDVLVK